MVIESARSSAAGWARVPLQTVDRLAEDEILYLAFLGKVLVGGMILIPVGSHLFLNNLTAGSEAKKYHLQGYLLWHAVNDLKDKAGAGHPYRMIISSVRLEDTEAADLFEKMYADPDMKKAPWLIYSENQVLAILGAHEGVAVHADVVEPLHMATPSLACCSAMYSVLSASPHDRERNWREPRSLCRTGPVRRSGW